MSDAAERLFVIIPCLNEARTIAGAVSEVLDYAPRLPMPVQLILIDDGSSDGTGEIISRLAEQHDSCQALINERNIGVGRAVMRAYDLIPDGSWVTVFPGDRELVFGASIDNFMAMRHDHDIILGYLGNAVVRTIARRFASRAYWLVTSAAYGFPWRYLNGLKMYRVEAFRGIEVKARGTAYVAELLAKAQLRRPELRIGEAPFYSRGRAAGVSSAYTPAAVVRAMKETHAGVRAVSGYRQEMLRKALPRADDDG